LVPVEDPDSALSISSYLITLCEVLKLMMTSSIYPDYTKEPCKCGSLCRKSRLIEILKFLKENNGHYVSVEGVKKQIVIETVEIYANR